MHFFLLQNDEELIVPEALGQGVLFVMSLTLALVLSNEERIRRHPRLQIVATVIVVFFLVGVDLALSFWFNRKSNFFQIEKADLEAAWFW